MELCGISSHITRVRMSVYCINVIYVTSGYRRAGGSEIEMNTGSMTPWPPPKTMYF